MAQLLEMNNEAVVDPLLRGLRYFYRMFPSGTYERPNLALSRAFATSTRLTGLPAPRVSLLAATEPDLGRCLYGRLSIKVEGQSLSNFLWTGCHEWRHLYLDTIVVWVTAFRCNGGKLIRSPRSDSLIRRTRTVFGQQSGEPLPRWFLQRVLLCPRCFRRLPLAEEIEWADRLVVAIRDRQSNERPFRQQELMARWEGIIERDATEETRSLLAHHLSTLSSGSINLFGGTSTARYGEVLQMDVPAMGEAILAELRARQKPAIRAAAEALHNNQLFEVESDRFAEECMAMLPDAGEASRLLEYLFGPKNSQ